MDFSESLKRARKLRLMTQKELAEKANLSLPAIKQWEAGRNEPKGDSIRALMNALNVSLDYLTGRTDDPEPVIQVEYTGGRADFIDEVINMPEDQFRRLMRYYELLKKETGGHES